MTDGINLILDGKEIPAKPAVGSLASGATATLTLNANVTGAVGTTVTNTASIIASNQPDPDASNNSGERRDLQRGIERTADPSAMGALLLRKQQLGRQIDALS